MEQRSSQASAATQTDAPSAAEEKAATGHGSAGNQHANRLIHESSPYLLQHAYNPVDWYPWGTEAFEKARRENKPIFLSVGYSCCHWCHVMEKESFENNEIASLMNEVQVNIKVDREERPDVDRVYMHFVQATTGSGGWPMSVWLTPDLKPFFGGTYFPPHDSFYGMPGFPSLLRRINRLWNEKRDELVEQGTRVMDALQEGAQHGEEEAGGMSHDEERNILLQAGDDVIVAGAASFLRQYDARYGGYGSAPKFPRAATFNFLFSAYNAPSVKDRTKQQVRDSLLFTLKQMSQGGMYDAIGGGFARYSVDKEFMIPHFEKMAYDQGQLLVAYAEAFRLSGDQSFARICHETIEYLRRDMTFVDPSTRNNPIGQRLAAFYSAEDADSLPTHQDTEKKEGAFYLWSYDELRQLLQRQPNDVEDPFEFLEKLYGLKPDGNIPPARDPHHEFGNKNILHQFMTFKEACDKFNITEEQGRQFFNERIKPVLLTTRSQRPRPHLDDKIITAWNALVISGLAKVAQYVGGENRQQYLDMANEIANFIKQHMYDQQGSGELLRSIRELRGNVKGFLPDYAYLTQALLDLYDAERGSERGLSWLQWAAELQRKQDELFADQAQGGWFETTGRDPTVLIRQKEDYDGAEPAGSSVGALNVLRLAMSGIYEQQEADRLQEFAVMTLGSHLDAMQSHPSAIPQMLVALNQFLVLNKYHVKRQLAIVFKEQRVADGSLQRFCDDLARQVEGVQGHLDTIFINTDRMKSNHVLSTVLNNLPHLQSIQETNGTVTAYLCQNFSCHSPTNDIGELGRLLLTTRHHH